MKQFRKWIQYAGLITGGVVLLYQIQGAISTLFERDIHLVSVPMLLLAFVPVMMAIGVQMMAWSSGMKSLGVDLSTQSVLQGYLLSFLPRYIPGTVWGYLSRSEWLHQDFRVSRKVSHQGSIVETMAAIVANLIVFNLPFLKNQLLLQFGLILLPFVLWYLFRLVSRVISLKKGNARSLIGTFFPEFRLNYWISSVVLFLLVWLLNGIGLMMVLGSFSDRPDVFGVENLIMLASIYAVAWLFGFFILFAPTGLGFRELALTSLLAMHLGVGFGYGSVLAILFRMVILLSEVIWLGVGIVLKKNILSKPLIDE